MSPLDATKGPDAELTAVDEAADMSALMVAVKKYFDLMYDCDTSRFSEVFVPTVTLHGFRDGKLQAWPAGVYIDVLNKRQSPKSLNAPRDNEILLVDFASPTQALVKARVRVANMMFIDHLTYHRIDGTWLITSKGFHVVSSAVA